MTLTKEFARQAYQKSPAPTRFAGVENGTGILSEALNGRHLATQSLPNRVLGIDSVAGQNVALETLGGVHLALASVGGARIAGLAVGSGHIATDAVTNAKIALGAVQSGNIGGLAVANPHLATDAVTNAKIAAGAVQSGNIGGLAVNTPHLATDAVTNAKMASASVYASNIALDQVGGGHLAPALFNPAASTVGVRSMDGASGSCAPFSHTHSSTAFVNRPKEWRRGVIALRGEMEEGRGSPEERFERLEKAVLASLSLHLDYGHMRAEEREDLLEDDSEEARVYKFRYRVDDWMGLDHEEILKIQARRQDELTAHPLFHRDHEHGGTL